MADILVKQPFTGRLASISEPGADFKMLRGVCSFADTGATGTLVVPGLTVVHQVQLTPQSAPFGYDDNFNVTLGTISATAGWTFRVPHFGTVTGVYFTTKDAITADNDNHWTFRLTNKGNAGAGSAAVILADSSNSTDANASPAGFSIAAYVTTGLFLGAEADLAVTFGNVLEFTATKAGAAGNMTESSLYLTISTGASSEALYVLSNSDGTIPLSGGKITIVRTGNAKLAGQRFAVTVIGR